MNTTNHAAHCRITATLRRLAQRVFGAWLLSASAVAVAAAPQPVNLLEDRAAWTLAPQPGGPRWDGNTLLVPALADGNAQLQQALRPITLGPAASWRAQMRLAAVQPNTADAALGMVLVAPTGNFLAVMMRPQERDLIVIRSNGKAWRQPLTGFVAAPMLAGPATAAHLLEVQSQGGRLRISIDGTAVLTTPFRDFRPSQMGLRASNTQAVVDQWVLQDTGQDPRLARLAGVLQAPGTQVCFEDKFEDGNTAARAAKSILSGVGSFFGAEPETPKSAKPPIDSRTAWSANWSDAESAFTRDTARKRLVLQTKGQDDIRQVSPNSHDPIYFAGVAVQATLSFPLLTPDANGGVLLQQAFPAEASGQKPDEMLFAQITPSDLLLYERTNTAAKPAQWQLITRVPHGGVAQRPFTLRLVHQAENAWVFIDGQLMIAADNVKQLRINNAGLRTEGVVTMEVSHFLFTEI